jgi:hypothetical protein
MRMPGSTLAVTVALCAVVSLLLTCRDYSYLPLLQLAENIASDADFHVVANPNPESR